MATSSDECKSVAAYVSPIYINRFIQNDDIPNAPCPILPCTFHLLLTIVETVNIYSAALFYIKIQCDIEKSQNICVP